jgi:hypothetical protein
MPVLPYDLSQPSAGALIRQPDATTAKLAVEAGD